MPLLADTKSKILSLHDELSASPSLKPGPRISHLFSELVDISATSSHGVAQALLKDEDVVRIIPQLRALSSAGEYQLETHWAGEILASAHPAITLEKFPYHENYLKLTELEFQSLKLVGSRPIKKVLFIGSGPLPLSSILMARRFGIYVDNLDNDRWERLPCRLRS